MYRRKLSRSKRVDPRVKEESSHVIEFAQRNYSRRCKMEEEAAKVIKDREASLRLRLKGYLEEKQHEKNKPYWKSSSNRQNIKVKNTINLNAIPPSSPRSSTFSSSRSSPRCKSPNSPPPRSTCLSAVSKTKQKLTTAIEEDQRLIGVRGRQVSRYRVLYPHEPNHPNELKLCTNFLVEKLDNGMESGWWFGRIIATGKTGYFPSNFVAPVEDENEIILNAIGSGRESEYSLGEESYATDSDMLSIESKFSLKRDLNLSEEGLFEEGKLEPQELELEGIEEIKFQNENEHLQDTSRRLSDMLFNEAFSNSNRSFKWI